MKRISTTILTLILASAAAYASAAPQEVAPTGFAQARQQFIAGSNGDGNARDAAIESFRSMAVSLPGHPILMAYEGAAITLQARDAMMPWNKLTLAEKGANAIEKALAQLTPAHEEAMFNGVPEGIETRMLAAETLLQLPDMMRRAPAAKRAIDAAIASPMFEHCPPQIRQRMLALAKQAEARVKGSAQ
jgi:hypothetical protein